MAGIIARLFRKPAAAPSWVEADELRERLARAAPPLVLDVRGPDEFDGPLGHIEGARNIPLPELAARQAEIARTGKPIVCVCLTDKRSAAAAMQLGAAGIGEVSVLRGGMKAWREAAL
jgi:rhodanese-related sulfurtransferase